MFGITGEAHFIRTTDKHHMESAQYFGNLLPKMALFIKKLRSKILYRL